MKPFAFQHLNLKDHPVFINLSVIQYNQPLQNEILIGSGKPYLCFIYGEITKLDSEGNFKKVNGIELQPVENHYSMSTEVNSKIIAIAIKPDLLYNITRSGIGNQTGNLFNGLEKEFQKQLIILKESLQDIHDIQKIWEVIKSQLDSFTYRWSNPTPISQIIDFIYQKKGNISLKDILERFPLAKSTLHAHFKKYIGVPPKFYVRLIHFNFVIREMLENNISIKNFIYDSNYYDYSHFKKDFQIFMGMKPTDLEKIKDKSLDNLFQNVAYRLK